MNFLGEFSLSFCILSVLFSIATTATAQQTRPLVAPVIAPPSRVPATESTATDSRMPDPGQGLIRVDVAVTDKAGKPVVGLSAKDFTLLDNDQQQKVVTFQAFNGGIQPASSLEVVLMIDELNMVPNAELGKENRDFSEAVHEVETLLRANGGVLEKPYMIYHLSKNGLFATPHASMNGNELADEIEHSGKLRRIWSPSEVAKDIADMEKGGPVSGRISHSLVALGSVAIEERRNPGRKLMFWIGNGWPIEDRRALGLSDFSIELLTRLREARISLWSASKWTIHDKSGNPVPVTDYPSRQLLKGPKPDSEGLDAIDFNFLSLPVIAVRSGGGVQYLRSNLAANIREQVIEESHFYSLTFDPPRTSVVDEYHQLKIEIDEPGLTAHAFQGYYDQPVFYDQPPIQQPVTVRELEALIATANNISRSELANQLEGVRLKERLDTSKLARLEKEVHGSEAREALEVVADEAVFLAPRPAEVDAAPMPDAATQHQILSKVISYVNTTLHKLPDFQATRNTVLYHEAPPKPTQTWKTAPADSSLHRGETAIARINFHEGKELVKDESTSGDPSLPQFRSIFTTITDENAMKPPRKSDSESLRTIGTFGAILATVMTAATSAHSELVWSRWEQGENGRVAVFRYRVPDETPLFTAEFCCLPIDSDAVPFAKPAPFHGEIAVDPSSGAILRLTIQADLESRLPLHISDVMVEYAPVVRGSRTFICPARSVSISRQRRTVIVSEWGERFKVYAPFETLLNEMRYDKYKIFGSTSRILPGFTEVPQGK